MNGFLIFQKIKKISKDKRIYSIFFLAVFLGLGAGDRVLKRQLEVYRVNSLPLSKTAAALPVVSSVLGENSQSLKEQSPEQGLSASSAIVMDNDSKSVLFAKNETIRFSPASTAKIMTALVALDYYHPDDVLTIQEDFVEGSVAGFRKGEKITFENLLYAMMLPSANDAAIAIAQNYPGGEEAFVSEMNKKAKAFHLVNTHFSDPAGLDDNENYITALDLARLASLAVENPGFVKVVGTKEKIIGSIDGNRYKLQNLNKLLGIDGITGIKTGFTDEAGGVLVTSKKIKTQDGEHTVIVVVMKSENRFWDTQQLISFVDKNLHYKILSSF